VSLYPFQLEAVEFGLKHHYHINASEMGLGKSLMAIETVNRTGLYPAIFCPAFLKGTWEHEMRRWGRVYVDRYAITPYTQLDKFDTASNFWIADECHYLKNPKAKRTQLFYELLKHHKPKYFIGLTGTPIKNRVPDFWTLLAFCQLNPLNTSGKKLEGDLSKYFAFSRHFCHTQEFKVSGRRVEKFLGIKQERIPELKALLKDKYIKYRVEDVLSDLPEMTRKDIYLDMSPVPGLHDEFNAYTNGRKINITAKVLSAKLKAPHTVEYCKEIIENGSGPLLIFSDHVDAAALIQDRLPRSALITGKTPMPDRQDICDRFQARKLDVIVATIGALSVGVTLTAASHVVFNDLSWVPADNLQAEKRIHRIGQKNACFAHYIDSSETDTYIRRMLMDKIDTIRKALG
jgi:SWI/SNF-related matrix-associated actin-dependent regulator of chromatin subfamily A-like protein 1